VFRKTDSETGIPIKIPVANAPAVNSNNPANGLFAACMKNVFITRHASSLLLMTIIIFLTETLSSNLIFKTFLKGCHETGPGLRFFGCGEYGSRTSRPHYHLLLLNSDFADKRIVKSGPQIISMTHLHCRSCGLLVHMPSAMSRSNRLRMSPVTA